MIKINFLAPYNSLGFGVFGRNLLKELDKLSNISYFPIGQPEILNQDDVNLIRKTCLQAELYDPRATSLRLWHQNNLAEHVGSKKISQIIFELDHFTKRETHHIESQDSIFVCSQWAKSIVLGTTKQTNVHVVPGGVDTNIFKPADFSYNNKNFIFITIGKWEVRKNHQGIIDAFISAFDNNTKAELWMVTDNPFLSNEDKDTWVRYVDSTKHNGRIKLFPHLQSQEELCRIINMADCGVQVSRGEGFDLPNLELFAASKPVIVSNYSAHTEYCNDKNSTLVPVVNTELANAVNYKVSTLFDRTHFYGQGSWGVVNTDDIVSAMRLEFNKGKRTNVEGLKTAKRFSWENTARKIMENL